MARKNKDNKDLMRGFKGWEKQYIKKSIKYGHMNIKGMGNVRPRDGK